MDVLDTFDEITLCTAYKLDGKILKSIPADADTLERVEPMYETMPGWKSSLTGIRTYQDLPQAAKDYIGRIETLSGARVTIISTSPDRADTIIRS